MSEERIIQIGEVRPHTTKTGRNCTLIIDGGTGEYYYDFRRKPAFYQGQNNVKITLRDNSKIVEAAEKLGSIEKGSEAEAHEKPKIAFSGTQQQSKGNTFHTERDTQIARLSVLRAICQGFSENFYAKIQSDETITTTAENIVRLWKETVKLAERERLI